MVRSSRMWSSTEADRETALDLCILGVRQIQHGNYPLHIDGLDIQAMATWYIGLSADVQTQMQSDDVFLRAVLGYNNKCLEFSATTSFPAQ
eukprot:gene17720-24079_t